MIWLNWLHVSRLNFAWQPTNACTVWHLLTSPGSAHRSPPSPVVHTCVLPINTNCSSPARLHRRLVDGRFPHRARCPGMLFPRSFVTQPSPSASSDNPWQLVFSTTIMIDCVSLLFCTFILLCFLGFRHRTRFRDSFCLARVFQMSVYLLTYLRLTVRCFSFRWSASRILVR